MEIILLEDIKKLGNIGDVVTVKNGFGRNFLIPQKKALLANSQNKKYYEERKTEIVKQNDGKKQEAKKGIESFLAHAGN